MQRIEADAAIESARQALYRFASVSLLDPRCGAWSLLADEQNARCASAAAELYREYRGPVVSSSQISVGERPLSELDPRRVLDRLPGSAEKLNAEFERTFGLLVSGNCPPYETEYINGKLTFQRSQHLADVAGFYRAFGLQPSRSHPERPDHIVLELEFMAFLIGLEQRAASEKPADPQRIQLCRQAQRRFLREHLVWWVPAFTRLIERQAPGGFYAAAGRLLAALTAAERIQFDLEPPKGNVAPSKIERPEQCEGCLLSP